MSLTALRAEDFSQRTADHFNDPAQEGKLFIPPAREALSIENTISFKYDSMEEAFPNVDPGEEPLGSLVMLMIRQPKTKAGSIILDTETRKTEYYNTQVAKVIAFGPLAFHNRNTAEPWPEGAWCEIGEFVRIPKYVGDRFTVAYNRKDFEVIDDKRREITSRDQVVFCLIKDLGLQTKVRDPLTVRAFIE